MILEVEAVSGVFGIKLRSDIVYVVVQTTSIAWRLKWQTKGKLFGKA
jgi:hypothetical protein